ncbi:hypothetical protein DdX_22331 [Ditylenchus destructor]|uniref:Uncharacterized protein n=1 Tax=Ditylenchus destructor TaxID=166010 RepID=A0AAD4QUV6_9BILA|nr:hypothetical protein DdX_22331 [Ditylenchus destructor]
MPPHQICEAGDGKRGPAAHPQPRAGHMDIEDADALLLEIVGRGLGEAAPGTGEHQQQPAPEQDGRQRARDL